MTEQEKESLYAAVMERANQKDTFGVENGMRIVAMGEGWARGELHTEVRHGNPMGIVHGGVQPRRAVPHRHLRRAVSGSGRGRRYADLPRGGGADGSQHRGDAGVGGGRRRHRVRRWHLHLPHEGRKMRKRGALPLGKRPSFYAVQNSRPYLSDRGRRTDSGRLPSYRARP